MDFFLLVASFPWTLPGNSLPERLPPRLTPESLDPAFDFRLCVLELGWHRHCTRDCTAGGVQLYVESCRQ